MAEDPRQTVAACTGCGRGYISLWRDDAACLACGAPVRRLPMPEPNLDDDHGTRMRRRDLVQRSSSVVREADQ